MLRHVEGLDMCIELMDIVTQYKMISMRQCEHVSEAGVEHVVALPLSLSPRSRGLPSSPG